jgi:hypothetical protein
MTLLLAYCLTAKEPFLRRMTRSIELQAYAPSPDTASIHKVLIVDVPAAQLPDSIRSFFGNSIVTVPPPFVVAYGRPRFCLSKFRNASIDHALARGYEWLMLCDCDTVVADYRFAAPPSGFGIPSVYWQTSAGETFAESMNTISDRGGDAFSKGNAWYTSRRDVFEKLRFNENIYGYGWEDVDLENRTRASGYHKGQTGMVIVHAFHPYAEKAIEHTLHLRNQAIGLATEGLARQGRDVSSPPPVDVAFAKHPHWSSALCFVLDEQRVFMVANKVWAHYHFADDGKLIIEWDRWPASAFRLEMGIYVSVPSAKAG